MSALDDKTLAELEAFADEIVAAAPPFSDAQADRIRAIFASDDCGDGAFIRACYSKLRKTTKRAADTTRPATDIAPAAAQQHGDRRASG